MPRRSLARIKYLAASALFVCLGCAESDPLDITDLAKHHGTDVTGLAGTSGTAGAGGPGIAGATGATGAAGASGIAGTTGAAGSKTSITSGQAGDSSITTTGTGGSGGDSSGQAGTTGGAGSAGTGFAGTTGSGGRGGSTGFAGRGGTTGSAGRGGTTGSAGRGGTTGTGGSSVDAGATPDGAATQTFTDIYNTILVTYCSGSSCHSPGSQAGISFASKSVAYDAVLPRVVPGNGASSSFYRTVNSGSMPRGQAKLSAANLAKIKAWIDQGALEN